MESAPARVFAYRHVPARGGATVGAGAALFAAASGAKADLAAPQRGHVHVSGSAAKGLPCFASS